ncbi:MAG: cation:proton antiporter [Gammaproteobacteria bacterium]|jgi:predicted Kef-type K+ transport protein|nr:cation:proton antiporter [Gammaproteobacteria bacterium]
MNLPLIPVLIAAAFFCGLAVKQVGLPPMVGFLAAGFILHVFGIESNEDLETVANFGVTLLLFSIGLKLKIKNLLRPEIWAVTTLHMGVTVVVLAMGILALRTAGWSAVAGLDLPLALLLSFALSFSSTVFAVKVLEEKGENGSLHGRIAIGILIMQDLLAVIFIAFSSGKLPSPWAFALFGLILLRPLLFRLMDRVGHGELFVLLGWLFPIAAAGLFDLVGLKADLGALLLGAMLAGHPKSAELSGALLGFKDLFLVAFFLTIGLAGTPTPGQVGVALVLVFVVPLKVALYYLLMTRFRLRARTATLGSLSLANYSEFGLIVGGIGVANGWLEQEWLATLAVAVSLTFALASPLNTLGHDLFARYREWLKRFEGEERIPGDGPIDPGQARIAVIGMGRVGQGAYDYLNDKHGEVVIGMDHDPEVVSANVAVGRNVFVGDATDSDFEDRAVMENEIQVVLLAMGDHAANVIVAELMREWGRADRLIAASARHSDQEQELKDVGVDVVFNFYEDAGSGFARRADELLTARS